MLTKARTYLKRLLPPSRRYFDRAIKGVRSTVQQSQADTTSSLNAGWSEIQDAIKASNEHTDAALSRYIATSERTLSELSAAVERMTTYTLEIQAGTAWPRTQQQEAKAQIQVLERTESALQSIEQSAARYGRSIDEALWADIFSSAIVSSDWLHDKTFAPGRWAVGYPYLYTLYRVLNETRPMRILDLGLGQSTRMIAQYAAAYDNVQHFVIEHDQEWIDFFSRGFQLPSQTRLLKLNWDYVSHNDASGVRVYAGFAEAIGNLQFDLISIDGPLGGDMMQYARIDVLSILPGCLAPSFVVMLDDYERAAESRTMREMQEVLSHAEVGYRSCSYSGSKDLGLLCSEDLKFLCSV